MINYSKDVSKDTSKAADLIIAETIRRIVEYVNIRFLDDGHSEAYWIDDLGEKHCIDYGYAHEWWDECMKPELNRLADVIEKGEN